MCVTYFHNLIRSQVTAWINSSERWKKFIRSSEILRLQVCSKKVPDAISQLMCPKRKLFAVKFRGILEVFTWWSLWRKFCANFHNLCVKKWSCVLRSLDAFWKFSPCEVYNKSSGRIIMIFASTNNAVCHEVQTDFGSFLRASFIQKLWAHFLNFCVQKWSCLLLSSDAFWKVWLCQVFKESFRRNLTIDASKTKLFAVEFRRILEVLCLQGLQKRFWAQFYNLCVQKWSCFLQSLDAFRKFSPCEVHNESSGCIIKIFTSTNEAVCHEVQTVLDVFSMQAS